MNLFTVQAVPILKDNYVWLIIDKLTAQAIAVDPGEASTVNNFLATSPLALKAILVTHHHWDHYNGVAELKALHNIPVYGNKHDKTPEITHAVAHNDQIELKLGNAILQADILAIPGHTLDHIAYYIQGHLFCGDTLFSAGCGRLFEGDAQMMYASLQKIKDLPNETIIYCAHEYTYNNLLFAHTVEPNNEKIASYLEDVKIKRQNNMPTLPSSLQLEKMINPFLRCDKNEVRQTVSHYAGKPLTEEVEIFAYLRQWKDNFRI